MPRQTVFNPLYYFFMKSFLKDVKYARGVEKKFTVLLSAADEQKVDVLYISDIGCGLFGNEPSSVGR